MLAPLPQKHAAKSPTLLRHLAGRYVNLAQQPKTALDN
jgi:hypothetical protein